MYFLFSGEGPTDLGTCGGNGESCEGAEFAHGPMVIFVDQIVEENHHYSFLEGEHYGFVSKHTLVERASEMKAIKKAVRLPGKKQPIETRYFYNNARVFARVAIERQQEVNDEVIGILFRDSDGTAAAGRGIWDDKRRSMIDGFIEEGFERGVPMVPKPKSEAWIICAVKNDPYQGCAALEDRSGNDNSPNSLKGELADILGEPATREILNPMVDDRTINVEQIGMPSLKAFRDRLEDVI